MAEDKTPDIVEGSYYDEIAKETVHYHIEFTETDTYPDGTVLMNGSPGTNANMSNWDSIGERGGGHCNSDCYMGSTLKRDKPLTRQQMIHDLTGGRAGESPWKLK